MEYKDFKGIKLSCLGMGNMRLPLKTNADKDIDYEKAQEIIDLAMKSGINYYDTAYVYHSGASEKFVGTALKKYDRDSFYVATKYLVGANPDYRATFEEQLEKLQMDHIDFYLIHCILDNNVDTYLTNGCIEYFLEQQKLGKIRYLGFSSHAGTETLERFASHHQWDFAQIQLNYFDWMYGNTKKEYEILTLRNIPIIAMESVRGGRLSSLSPDAEKLLKDSHPEWSISSWAFRWLKTLPNLQVALSGMGTVEQVEDNVATYSDGKALSAEETELLFKACQVFQSNVKVPCTACRYCCDGCPASINIPEVLKVYNKFKVDGKDALNGLKNIQTEGMPGDCVSCGACTGHCPQNINVPEIMQELAGLGY